MNADVAPPSPYDPELVAPLEAFRAAVEAVPLRAETLRLNRATFAALIPDLAEIIGDRPVRVQDRTISGPPGQPAVTVTVVTPTAGSTAPRPGVVSFHGGGMILGTRLFGLDELIDLVLDLDAVGVTPEYRLAPEDPFPAGVEDCYAALAWTDAHAAELGVDPQRLLLAGFSAGGGLSAAVALMARDRGGPRLLAQMLGAPMLDDRNITVSSRQFDGIGIWDRATNAAAWTALLGDRRGGDEVSCYAAPARAQDLSGLPPAFIEVGAAELFRDEAVEYAGRIWAAGGQAELHSWADAYHGFSGSAPASIAARAANAARRSFYQRILAPGSSSR